MKTVLIALFSLILSVPAMAQKASDEKSGFATEGACMAQKAPDEKSGFATEGACIAAVRAGKAVQYTPVTNRAPGLSFTKMKMRDTEYKNGACVTGLTTFADETWVYLGPNFEVGKSGETLVMWQCGNAITRISKIPFDQVISRSAPVTSFGIAPQSCTASAEKCEMITWCDQNKGWETRTVNGKIEQFCSVPSIDRFVQRVTTTTVEDKHIIVPVQTVEVRPVQAAAPVSVDFPNAQVNVRGGGVNVIGTKCQFDCKTRETVRDVPGFQNQPSPNGQCEIRWKAGSQEGRLLLDKDPQTGKLRLASVLPGQSSPSKVMNTPATATTDCNADQALVKKEWDSVVRMMSLPATCKPM